MKKIFYLLLLFFHISFFTFSQNTFLKNLEGGGNYARQTFDGGFIITHGSHANIGDDISLVRTNASGDTLWTKTFRATGDDNSYDVRQTIDSGFIITGTTKSFIANGEVFLIKTDASGNRLWSKTYGASNGVSGLAMELTSDSGYIVCGKINFASGNSGIYLIKTNASGDTLWTKSYGEGAFNEMPYSIRQGYDDGYIISGFSNSFNTSPTLYIVKTDAVGNIQWSKKYEDRFGAVADIVCKSLRQTTDNGYIFTGYQGRTSHIKNAFLLKTDSSGNVSWLKTYRLGNHNYNVGNDVLQTNDGSFVFTGYSGSVTSVYFNTSLLKTDSLGYVVFSKIFNDMPIAGISHQGLSIEQTSDAGFVIGGNDQVIKTDAAGDIACFTNDAIYTQDTINIYPVIHTTIVAATNTIVTSRTFGTGNDTAITTLCTTVGIQPAIQTPQSQIFLSPNPFSSVLNLRFPAQQSSNALLKIFNSIGKVMAEKEIQLEDQTLDLSALPQGIYLVSVRANNFIYNQKIVK